MATGVVVPRLGTRAESGTIVQWLKSIGDEVESGEPLIEIATDKVNIEVAALTSGVLLRQLFIEGERVPVDTVVGYIGEEGEELPDVKARHGSGGIPSLNFSGLRNHYDDSRTSEDNESQWEQVGHYLGRREQKMSEVTIRVEEKISGLSQEVGQLDKVLLRLCDFQLELMQDMQSLRREISRLTQQNEKLSEKVMEWVEFREQDDEEVAAGLANEPVDVAGNRRNEPADVADNSRAEPVDVAGSSRNEPVLQTLPKEVVSESDSHGRKLGFFKRVFG